MEATITADAIENQAAIGTLYVPARHVVLKDSLWLLSFKQYAKVRGIDYTDDLFVYYHRIAGTYVLSLWLERPGHHGRPGTMRELEALKGNPARTQWEHEIDAYDIEGELIKKKVVEKARPPTFACLMESLVPHIVVVKKLRRAALARARAQMSERELEQDERREYAKHLEHKFGFHDRTPQLIRSGMLPFAVTDPKDDTALRLMDALRDPECVRDIKHRR